MSEKGLREQVVKNIINRRLLDEQSWQGAGSGTKSGGTKSGGGSEVFSGAIAGLEGDDAFSIAPAVLNQMIRQQNPQTPQEVQAGVLEILKWLSDLLNPNQENVVRQQDPTKGY